MVQAFSVEAFIARFPEFDNQEKYPYASLQNYGDRAAMHISLLSSPDMPLQHPFREYAVFLAAAHIATLATEDDSNGGGMSLGGMPFKATVGSVSVETTKQNTFTTDDWALWFGKTKYGQELLALLDVHSSPGIFLNTPADSVRDLV
jgi:hypothetical protein